MIIIFFLISLVLCDITVLKNNNDTNLVILTKKGNFVYGEQIKIYTNVIKNVVIENTPYFGYVDNICYNSFYCCVGKIIKTHTLDKICKSANGGSCNATITNINNLCNSNCPLLTNIFFNINKEDFKCFYPHIITSTLTDIIIEYNNTNTTYNLDTEIKVGENNLTIKNFPTKQIKYFIQHISSLSNVYPYFSCNKSSVSYNILDENNIKVFNNTNFVDIHYLDCENGYINFNTTYSNKDFNPIKGGYYSNNQINYIEVEGQKQITISATDLIVIKQLNKGCFIPQSPSCNNGLCCFDIKCLDNEYKYINISFYPEHNNMKNLFKSFTDNEKLKLCISFIDGYPKQIFDNYFLHSLVMVDFNLGSSYDYRFDEKDIVNNVVVNTQSYLLERNTFVGLTIFFFITSMMFLLFGIFMYIKMFKPHLLMLKREENVMLIDKEIIKESDLRRSIIEDEDNSSTDDKVVPLTPEQIKNSSFILEDQETDTKSVGYENEHNDIDNEEFERKINKKRKNRISKMVDKGKEVIRDFKESLN